MAVSEVDLISALNRINQSMRSVSITTRLFHYTVESLVDPLKLLTSAIGASRTITDQATKDYSDYTNKLAVNSRRNATYYQQIADQLAKALFLTPPHLVTKEQVNQTNRADEKARAAEAHASAAEKVAEAAIAAVVLTRTYTGLIGATRAFTSSLRYFLNSFSSVGQIFTLSNAVQKFKTYFPEMSTVIHAVIANLALRSMAGQGGTQTTANYLAKNFSTVALIRNIANNVLSLDQALHLLRYNLPETASLIHAVVSNLASRSLVRVGSTGFTPNYLAQNFQTSALLRMIGQHIATSSIGRGVSSIYRTARGLGRNAYKLVRPATATNPAGPLRAGAALAARGIGALGAGIIAFIGPLAALSGVMGAMVGVVGALVGLFDPSIVKQFTMAVQDSMAAFGEILRPIIVAAIPAVIMLGDTIATMRPAFEPLIQFFVLSIGMLVTLWGHGAKLLTPLISLLGQSLLGLRPILILLVEGIGHVADALIYLVNVVIKAVNELIKATPGTGKPFNILKLEDLSKQSSVGKAVRGTTNLSAEEMGKKFREGAYGASSGWDKVVNEQKITNNQLKELNQNLQVYQGRINALIYRKGELLRDSFLSSKTTPEGRAREEELARVEEQLKQLQEQQRVTNNILRASQ